MYNQNSPLAALSERYRNCNLLMPVTSEVQLNPFYKITVMEVQANTLDGAGDIFKVGSVNAGGNWINQYSPAKPLLMKIAAAAGIQFDPDHTYGTYVDGQKNCYRAKAYGAMRMPDGTGKTHADEKVINLEDEEDKFRLEFMDKSIRGIPDKKQAEEAAKMFKGEWRDTKDKNGKPCKGFFVSEADRQKYIDRGVLVNMTLLRKTMPEKAMTGAILRVIRALVGIKGTYTIEELERPFAIPRVSFAPDFNDPEVRREIMMQGMSSIGGMFGPSAPAASRILSEPIGSSDPFNPDEFTGNAAFQSDHEPDSQPEYDPSTDNGDGDPPAQSLYEYGRRTPPAQSTPPTAPESNPICAECGNSIGSSVASYSMRKYGQYLCRDHQPN